MLILERLMPPRNERERVQRWLLLLSDGCRTQLQREMEERLRDVEREEAR